MAPYIPVMLALIGLASSLIALGSGIVAYFMRRLNAKIGKVEEAQQHTVSTLAATATALADNTKITAETKEKTVEIYHLTNSGHSELKKALAVSEERANGLKTLIAEMAANKQDAKIQEWAAKKEPKPEEKAG